MSIQEKIFPTPMRAEALGGSVKLSGVRAEAGAEFALASFLHAAEGSGLVACADGNVCLVMDVSISGCESVR